MLVLVLVLALALAPENRRVFGSGSGSDSGLPLLCIPRLLPGYVYVCTHACADVFAKAHASKDVRGFAHRDRDQEHTRCIGFVRLDCSRACMSAMDD